MDAKEFHARILTWKQIHELPNEWPPARFLSLLARLEVDDVAESEAEEMTVLALQDLDLDDAADHVLAEVFGERMRRGIRENLAHDLTEGRPWEDFPDLSHQAGIFNAIVLLNQAFPHDIRRPDAVEVRVAIETESVQGGGWLDAVAPDPALLIRILAKGMSERALLWRLFDESVLGSRFPEAASILWRVTREAGTSREFSLISSHPWFDPLEEADSWTVKAKGDAPAPAKHE